MIEEYLILNLYLLSRHVYFLANILLKFLILKIVSKNIDIINRSLTMNSMHQTFRLKLDLMYVVNSFKHKF